CRTTKVHVRFGFVRFIPNLFGQQPCRFSESFHRSYVGTYIAACGKLIVPALAGKQRPDASLANPLPRPAGSRLAIPVMVITPPARTERGFYFEHRVNDLQGIFNQRIARLAYSIAH